LIAQGTVDSHLSLKNDAPFSQIIGSEDERRNGRNTTLATGIIGTAVGPPNGNANILPRFGGAFLWGHRPDIFREEFEGGRVVLPPALLP
jgi:hypothetical protein